MHLSGGDDSISMDIPCAPQAPSSPPTTYNPSSEAASPVPPPFKAYVPQPTAPPAPAPIVVPGSSNLQQFYAQSPPPTFSRPPTANNDPRVQDTVELCNFAILALKVQ